MNASLSSWQRIRRTPYQALASVFMIFITLFVMAMFFLLAATSSAVLSYFESKPQVTVFFTDDIEKATIDQLVGSIQSTGKVANLIYVSKEQALSIYREQNKSDPLLLEMVTADILPASLEITAVSPQYLSELADLARGHEGIDEVVFQKDIVDSLVSWTSFVRKGGVFVLAFLVITTFFILLTSIGMKIAMRKEEIEILKLVGATPWYIKRPFLLEGMTYGVFGATLAWSFVLGLTFYIHPFLSSFLQGIPPLMYTFLQGVSIGLWPPSLALSLLLVFSVTFAGLGIGLIGSLFAVSRYMKH